MLSERDWLIDCFYRIIVVNRRVNPRIGVRKAFPSARLGIFLDKRVGFAGGDARWRYGGFGVMAIIVVTALWIHTDGNAGAASLWRCRSVEWCGRGMGGEMLEWLI